MCEVGKVTDVKLTPAGAEATLTLNTSPKIPSDLKARCAACPRSASSTWICCRAPTPAPYLQDGSVIAVQDTTIPQAVGPMLDQASKLIESIPKERISDLLDESFTAFNGAGYDLQSLLDSASTITRDANADRPTRPVR